MKSLYAALFWLLGGTVIDKARQMDEATAENRERADALKRLLDDMRKQERDNGRAAAGDRPR
ncbi:MAG: hypothetical protein KDA41_17325 [Planctomycetales bacterium]|nr:hypothetical protein [Planctomycetales bacterium]